MKSFITLLVLVSVNLITTAQDFNLKILVEGIEEQKGTIYFSLHNKEDGFPSGNESAIKTGQTSTFSDTAVYTFQNLPKGTYAISFFQDLNANAELDTNFIGIPKEPVGASNQDAFGRPKFSKSKFTLTEDYTLRVSFMN